MPETHDFGNGRYWHLQRYPRPAGLLARIRHWRRRGPAVVKLKVGRPPLREEANTYEVEEPYRVGHGRALRLWPLRWALVHGVWGEPAPQTATESQLLTRAMKGAMLAVPATQIGSWPGPAGDLPETDWQPGVDLALLPPAAHE